MSRYSAATIPLVLAGCLAHTTAWRWHQQVPTGTVQQVHAAWENRIVVTQDVVNGGRPLIGIAGRIYLMEDFGKCVQAAGNVSVELYDATHANAQSPPKIMERFEIDKDTLKRLLQKDDIGWGYTVFLPWSTYRPDVKRVQLQVKWQPDSGVTLYSPPAVVVLNGERHHQFTSTQRRVTPDELQNNSVFGMPPPTPPRATQP
ncbi:MAG: hypothetical protein NZO58_05995 [Gemmataceae bacterium]|nr:hypothetical protein [Gemmataceae bacterium]